LRLPRLTAVPNGPRVGEDIAYRFSTAQKGMPVPTELPRGPLALRLNDLLARKAPTSRQTVLKSLFASEGNDQ